MMRHGRALASALVLAGSFGCSSPEYPASTSFYDRKIGPILIQSCGKSPTQSGCHVAADDRGNALGNLNVESYETLSLRRDLFAAYGPYGLPGLIVKASPSFQISLTTWESTDPTIITTEVPHAGGPLLDVTSTSYTQLIQWIERGAQENNTVAPPPPKDRTRCSGAVGNDPAFDPAVDSDRPDYDQFRSKVNPVLTENCAAGNCHGSAVNSLYLTCGDTDEQIRWNYFAVSDYVSAQPDSSEILRRTLSTSSGGTYHEGGTIFQSVDDAGYKAILAWATEHGGAVAPDDPGFQFFAGRVQPMLVKKGCMLLGCHSPAMGHDYRLRGGSGGHFGLPATRRNYELTLSQVALESEDPNASRIIRKNLVPFLPDPPPGSPPPLGITHRGGAILGFAQDDCDLEAARTGPLDEQRAYCVIRAWIELEREARLGAAPPFDSIVYVSRPQRSTRDAAQDFDEFVAGADLIRAPAAFAADGSLTVSGGTSLLGQCGLSGVDVRRPSVSWDGLRIAFSARASASEPWRVYVIDGATCAVEPTIDAAPVDDRGGAVPDNGELIHNFDPVFSPDGRIVFSSTRGNVSNTQVFDYSGPQRTPADPGKQNANLYVAEDGRVRQLTFLLNQELTPSFMSDGRVIMVTEKRAPGFYQLAGRRQNLDGGDYHPLFGQRATIGYNQLTDVVELVDKNFAAILSDRGAVHGGGVLAIVNRSIGIDQQSEDPAAYLQDPDAMTFQNPRFFQRALRLIDGVGRPGEGGNVFRSPAPLPNGNLIVSMAPGVPDVGAFGGGYDLYVVNPVSGATFGPVVSGAEDLLWPVAVFARADHGVFVSNLGEPNGASIVHTDEARRATAEVLFLDVPLLSSLIFQNTRSRRIVPGSTPLEFWESLPPAPGVTSFAGGGEFVTSDDFGDLYVRRRQLGSVIPFAEDGSAHVAVPGGMPLVLAANVRLAGEDKASQHFQREEMQFYPGESIRQGFRAELFNGMCGGCHGSVNGAESHVAVNPDILTQASAVAARGERPKPLAPSSGAGQGPPFP